MGLYHSVRVRFRKPYQGDVICLSGEIPITSKKIPARLLARPQLPQPRGHRIEGRRCQASPQLCRLHRQTGEGSLRPLRHEAAPTSALIPVSSPIRPLLISSGRSRDAECTVERD